MGVVICPGSLGGHHHLPLFFFGHHARWHGGVVIASRTIELLQWSSVPCWPGCVWPSFPPANVGG